MTIKVLAENTAISDDFRSEHGLSLYIETKKHKLLFDTGASALFAENAEKMDVDLSKVDSAVISHGHYDHGGGLDTFLSINSKANIYMNRNVFGQYYSQRADGEKKYIGLNKDLLPNDRFLFVDDQLLLDDELEIFSGVKGRRFWPSGNRDLFMKTGASFVQDDFAHEQNLIIHDGSQKVLVAGCAHNGIANILDHFMIHHGYPPSHIIGGFHLYNRAAGTHEDDAVTVQIGEYLLNAHAECYTCHCTGMESFTKLKSIMGDTIHYLTTGSRLNI